MLGRADRDDLVRALRSINVGHRHGTPGADSRVRIEARGDELVLTGTAPDLTVRTVVANRVYATGGVVVPTHTLERYITTVEGEIDLDLEANHLAVRAGRSHLRLVRFDDEAWPRATRPETEPLALSGDDMGALARVMHAAAGERAVNPALAGVYLDGTWAVTTDGYRLAAAPLTVELPPTLPPASTVARVIDACPEGVTLAADGQAATFNGPIIEWTTRLVDAAFPDWPRLLPVADATPHRLVANRRQLLDAARRTETLGMGETGFPKLVIAPASERRLRIESEGPDVGIAVDEIDGTVPEPLAFNARYLRLALEQLAGDRLNGRFASATGPMVFEEQDWVRLAVMPVRT